MDIDDFANDPQTMFSVVVQQLNGFAICRHCPKTQWISRNFRISDFQKFREFRNPQNIKDFAGCRILSFLCQGCKMPSVKVEISWPCYCCEEGFQRINNFSGARWGLGLLSVPGGEHKAVSTFPLNTHQNLLIFITDNISSAEFFMFFV